MMKKYSWAAALAAASVGMITTLVRAERRPAPSASRTLAVPSIESASDTNDEYETAVAEIWDY